MRLKSFGCSFIFGTDLADDGRDGPYATPSNFTWPALIAKQLGAGYLCRARGGAGNLQILDRILIEAAVSDPKTDIFVINWSWIERFDYGHGVTDPIPGTWKTICAVSNSAQAQNYYRHLHTEYRDKLSTLICMYTAINMLNSKGIKFYMTYMDDLVFDQKYNAAPGLVDLQTQVIPYMNNFDGLTFLEWSQKNNFPISKTQHPLELAHALAAEFMLPKIQSQLGINKI
jgi:hypothetical protein